MVLGPQYERVWENIEVAMREAVSAKKFMYEE